MEGSLPLYSKVLLAYDGSIEGRRALREGAKIAQLCNASVFLLAVAEVSAGGGSIEGGFISVAEQVETFQKILEEGAERLRAMGFSPPPGSAWESRAARSPVLQGRSEPTSWWSDIGRMDRWRDGGSVRSAPIWSSTFPAVS